MAYALAAGCTVVLKPSEQAPITAFILAEIIDAAGFPAGTFNLVTGLGPVVGERLAEHPDVDMISFTGSTGGGQACRSRWLWDGEADRPGTGWQIGQCAPRRRRLPVGRCCGCCSLLPELRPDL